MQKKQNTILKVHAHDSLIEFLLSKMGGMSKTSVKQLLHARRVQVNGAVQTHPETELNNGDIVTVIPGAGNVTLHHPKLKLIYEDDDLIVVNKKQGLLTVPSVEGSQETTAYSILKAYVKRQNNRNGIYVVHRLDRETSGLLVFAKSPKLQEYMREWWRDLVQSRTYVALAEGAFDEQEGTITTWLTEDKRNAMVYSSPTDNGGAKSITHYHVLGTRTLAANNTDEQTTLSLVELHLETGRTNQIRVHLATIGHPVVGDRKYGRGNDYSPVDRLCLHARELEFIHPVTEKRMHFETPIPKEFRI